MTATDRRRVCCSVESMVGDAEQSDAWGERERELPESDAALLKQEKKGGDGGWRKPSQGHRGSNQRTRKETGIQISDFFF